MKTKHFLLASICLFISANLFAQLRVRPSGYTMLGDNSFEINGPLMDHRDTTTVLKVYGQGTYGAKGRISIGDQYFAGTYHVILGEADNNNSDKLWLHGLNGLCATFNSTATDTVFYYYPLVEDVLNIKCPVRSNGIYLTSDERLKENVEHIDDALSVISALNGVSYQYKPIQMPKQDDALLNELAAIDPTGNTSRHKADFDNFYANRNDRSIHYGFLAQEVENVLPELVHTDKDGIKSLDYIAVIPLLVNAIQELRAELAEVKGEDPQSVPAHASRKTTGTDEILDGQLKPELYQNIPNPFNADTQIRYRLPETVHQADLYVYDLQGKQVKKIAVTEHGEAAVTIHGNELQAGMYIYCLIADGKEIASKRMILTR